MNYKRILRNLIYAIEAQGISLLLNVLMSLIVPKLLGTTEYGYWQLFIFYIGYVGLFHLGLNDGVYLKHGGTKYKELDKSLIGSQYRFGALFQSIISVFIMIFAIFFVDENQRTFVLMAASIYLLLYNLSLYLGYVFQAVNETKLYSISVMIDKIIFIISILVLLFVRISHFEVYVILYLLAKLASLMYCTYKGKEIVFAKNLSFDITLKESIHSIRIGINLMFANLAGQLILGIGRYVIDEIWGIETFGKFSFALSMTQFFLLFLSQVSMVLFPALRQSNKKQQNKLYAIARDGLSLFLPLAFIAYIPLKILLARWLPQYETSLEYMALLLPLCNFDGKMNMLCVTYFKVLRKEKFLLKVNIITMFISLILSLIGGYLIKSIYAIIIFMVISNAFRSIFSELYLAKLMKKKIIKTIIQEVILVAIFMFSSWYLSSVMAFGIISVSYIVYLAFNLKKCKQIFAFGKNMLKNV